MDSSITLGTPAHMLRRNEHPDTSDKAAREFNTSKGEARVLVVVYDRWERGLDTIGDDVLEHYGVSDQREHAVSESGYKARLSALQRKGYICLTGERRDGHRFGKSQQCWRPMSEEEREAFLEGRRDFEDVVIDDYILEKVVVVREGTQAGNATVDLILKDEKGNKFVVMVTGNLLKSIPC